MPYKLINLCFNRYLGILSVFIFAKMFKNICILGSFIDLA